MQRAEAIINKCAHPDYRPYLREYLKSSQMGHIRHNLHKAFELHCNLLEHGAMLPDLE
jgi:acetyl-CoA hydrolase